MRRTVLFFAVLFTWFGIESGNAHARPMLTTFASVPVGATPYAIPPGSAPRNPDAGEFGRLAQTPNTLAPEDPAQQAWATVQDTSDPAVLEDHRGRGDVKYPVDLLFDDQQRGTGTVDSAQPVVDGVDHHRCEAE